ncbi:Predicted DNA binding protein, contains HTH domain [Halogranum gelatinilyticum]|uniref:Predicted DNA binding protein, contains HTH domain n=1 Tax=Halogranum gelatinilyticum TaxID=660521 RepID=A0A1G9YQS3_9EURY|nr:helix-turn-helix domain-containing protein [Halogranum gelatinilyticum]SDN10786.1 Predicted DNA binding protein, contains HTH domain [Halogranum gelatinilyticum]
MPQANLTITVPEGIWIGDLSRAHPDASVRILAAHTDGDGGVGLAEITAPDLPAVVADIETHDSVTELDLLERYDQTVLVQFETTMPLLLFPMQDSGVPLTMPFTIEEGTAEWEITAPQHRLSELGDQLEEFGIPFTVNEVHQYVEPEQLLTDRQLTLVRTAVEQGYYDTPRQCSLTDLADELGLAKSTCSETLHRAEETIVKRFVEDFEQTLVDHPEK